MHKIVSKVGEAIDGLYTAKQNQLVGKNVDKYVKYINENMSLINNRIKNASHFVEDEGIEEYQKKTFTLIASVLDAIDLCQEYEKRIGNTSKYNSFEQLRLQVSSYTTSLKEVIQLVSKGEYVGSFTFSDNILDDSDIDVIVPSKKVSEAQLAYLIFGVFFGYIPKDSSLIDLSAINSTSCKLMLRIPVIGYLIFPTGYDDEIFWSAYSSTSSSWLKEFRNEIIYSLDYFRNIRRRFKRILIRKRSLGTCLSDSELTKIESFFNDKTLSNTYLGEDDDDDENFLKNVNSILMDVSPDLFQERAFLLPVYGLKGVSNTAPKFVPKYFPNYNPWNEMLYAVIMVINRLITTYCSGSKQYFGKIETGAKFSSELYSDIDSWQTSDLKILSETTTTPSSTSFDESLITTDSDLTSNPTASITNTIFEEESLSKLYQMKYYTASNDKLKDNIIPSIEDGSSSSIFSLYNDSKTYKYIMSAYEYMCFDPTVNPTSEEGIEGDIPFRSMIRVEFVKNVFKGDLLFPIAPYVGTNFINTWLLSNTTNDERRYLPQHIFEKGTHEILSSETSFSYPNEYTFSIHAFFGNISGEETIPKEDLFTTTYNVS